MRNPGYQPKYFPAKHFPEAVKLWTMNLLFLLTCFGIPAAFAQDTVTKFVMYGSYPTAVEVIISPAISLSGRNITWTAASGAAHYELERYNSVTGVWEVIYSGSNTSYYLRYLDPGANQFRVRTCISGRCSLASNAISVTPGQVDSDGDGIPDYLDAYPLQNDLQCTP